jgi:hypothetical protein
LSYLFDRSGGEKISQANQDQASYNRRIAKIMKGGIAMDYINIENERNPIDKNVARYQKEKCAEIE